jgi:alpha-ketoglutarate-dependent taurine dioxygenase
MDASSSRLLEVIEAPERRSLSAWARGNHPLIRQLLSDKGAILFRGGFAVDGLEEFERFAHASAEGAPVKYTERSSPRSEIRDRIYTSTDHPADQSIIMHSEQSYNLDFPLRICFHCAEPAASGGRTPIASNRAILEKLSSDSVERFRRKGILYQRYYYPGIGLSWQEAFGKQSRADVEAYCAARDIRCEWRGSNRLRTTQVRPALRAHPYTGEETWFNHGWFFNVESLGGEKAALIKECMPEDEYPTQTYWGDGSRIEVGVLGELRAAYDECAERFDWRAGDVLLLDNMLVSHGREPYEGRRAVYTFMQDLVKEASALLPSPPDRIAGAA